jgi:hypothetical protein
MFNDGYIRNDDDLEEEKRGRSCKIPSSYSCNDISKDAANYQTKRYRRQSYESASIHGGRHLDAVSRDVGSKSDSSLYHPPRIRTTSNASHLSGPALWPKNIDYNPNNQLIINTNFGSVLIGNMGVDDTLNSLKTSSISSLVHGHDTTFFGSFSSSSRSSSVSNMSLQSRLVDTKLPEDLDDFFVELENMIAIPQPQAPTDEQLHPVKGMPTVNSDSHCSQVQQEVSVEDLLNRSNQNHGLQAPSQPTKINHRHSIDMARLRTNQLSTMTEEDVFIDCNEPHSSKLPRSKSVPYKTIGGLHNLLIGGASSTETLAKSERISIIDSAYGSEQQIGGKQPANSLPLNGFKGARAFKSLFRTQK